MIKTKVAFLKGRLFSSLSNLFENFSDCSDWLGKCRPSKKATFVLIIWTGYWWNWLQGHSQPGASEGEAPLEKNSPPLTKSGHLAFKVVIKNRKMLKIKP